MPSTACKKFQPAPTTWSRSWPSERHCIIWIIWIISGASPARLGVGVASSEGPKVAHALLRERVEALDIPEVERAAVLDGDRIRYGVPSLFRRLAAAKLQCWTVGFCGSEGGLPDYSPPIEYTHHAAHISGRMMATFDAGGSWPWDILWDRCPVRRYVHAPFLHLGPAAMRRERRSQAEAKQSQGEAAKLAEEGARARDHHNNELVFRPKKARVKQIRCVPISARDAAPLLLWACHVEGPVLTRIEAVPVHAT